MFLIPFRQILEVPEEIDLCKIASLESPLPIRNRYNLSLTNSRSIGTVSGSAEMDYSLLVQSLSTTVSGYIAIDFK